MYKTQIRILAKKLDIPKKIIDKKSGPRLWKNHDAEEELQMTYEQLDPILYLYSNDLIQENSLSMKQKNILNNIKNRNIKFSHKNKIPEICKFD